ncbi:glycoside hydrolase superfamily [Panaeolus papilionaceus]|nr:glycoside hydrolase superfamily [Panaeolus papilionaceus]
MVSPSVDSCCHKFDSESTKAIMKWLHLASLLSAAVIVCATPVESEGNSFMKRAVLQGVDVSFNDQSVDWYAASAHGFVFTYIEATGGTQYINLAYTEQAEGARDAHIDFIGPYHEAQPDLSSGAVQAAFFYAQSSIQDTELPGALHLENNPVGPSCYGLDQTSMVNWIQEFSDAYHTLDPSHRYPVIYTTTKWWKLCTGNTDTFGETNALWLGRAGSVIPEDELPAGWQSYTLWQSANSQHDTLLANQDTFSGDIDALFRFSRDGKI